MGGFLKGRAFRNLFEADRRITTVQACMVGLGSLQARARGFGHDRSEWCGFLLLLSIISRLSHWQGVRGACRSLMSFGWVLLVSAENWARFQERYYFISSSLVRFRFRLLRNGRGLSRLDARRAIHHIPTAQRTTGGPNIKSNCSQYGIN
jgi:hypothetical protein